MKYIILILLTLLTGSISAQTGEIEMADVMFENGKIYVVITVLCTVFIGLVIYTIMIDRRLSRFEKEINEK
tara:strand:+ start:244 stop:456 length:213 start_codon:yes stop_codon:yes gene_type:complete